MLLASAATAMPIEYNKCSRQVSVHDPDGLSATTYFNEDCTQLYIMPPSIGKIKVERVERQPDLKANCETLHKLHAHALELDTTLLDAAKRLSNEDESFDHYKEVSKKVSEELNILEPQIAAISTLPGAKVAFILNSGQKELVAAYQKANPHLTVLPVSMDQFYISTASGKVDLSTRPAKLDIEVDGAEQSQMKGLPEGTFLFHEDLRAHVQLSVVGACQVSKKTVAVYLPATLTYTYQVMSENGQTVTRLGTSALW